MSNLTFSARLQQLRKTHHLSLTQLAELIGKEKTTISSIESGKIGTTIDVIAELADLFAVSVDWLLGRADEPYTLDVIEKLEQKILTKQETLDQMINTNSLNSPHWLYLKSFVVGSDIDILYFPVEEREKYSLKQCAEIIFILNFLEKTITEMVKHGIGVPDTSFIETFYKFKQIDYDESDEALDEYHRLGDELIEKTIKIFKQTRSSKRAGTAFEILCHKYKETLNEIIDHPES